MATPSPPNPLITNYESLYNHNSLPVINGLWISGELSALEWLTIYSFLKNGYEFHLWMYVPISQILPEGMHLKDASLIIPHNQVFSYTNEVDCGFKKGSFAGFSDVFRYKLLYENGGWWADMDITCLKRLDFDAPYFFRPHDQLAVVGNLMKCPPKCDLMYYCYERAKVEVCTENTDWLKPIQILNDGIKKYELERFIVRKVTNIDRWEVVQRLRIYGGRLNGNWYAIHWLNELWRSKGLVKNNVFENSMFEKLLIRYEVPVDLYFVLKPSWKDWLNEKKETYQLWKSKTIGWLKKPGVPRFIVRYVEELRGGH